MLVPRPISSRITRLRRVARRRISAASFISTMNVDRPRVSASDAPTLVNTRSATPTAAASAGTKLPIWAMIAVSATWRITVDFPAMFGPVTSITWFVSTSRRTSLGP